MCAAVMGTEEWLHEADVTAPAPAKYIPSHHVASELFSHIHLIFPPGNHQHPGSELDSMESIFACYFLHPSILQLGQLPLHAH